MLNAPSRARLIFEDFTGLNAAEVLTALPSQNPKIPEDQWFDCKSGRASGKDLDTAWSKALGAFANNEGGVVVWGLIAEHDAQTGVDAVCGVDLVPDVFKLKSRLVELQRKANDPPIQGVEIAAVPVGENEVSGFVVCFIPESTFKPHRSELAGQRFFLRVGDSSEPCSVALLRQLFYPKAVARLAVNVRRVSRHLTGHITLKESPEKQNDVKACFEISVSNIGMTSISKVYLRIENGANFVVELEDAETKIPDCRLKKFKSLEATRYMSSDIHPGLRTIVEVCVVSTAQKWAEEPWVFTVFCRDMPPMIGTLLIGNDEAREEPIKVILEPTRLTPKH